MKDVLSALRKAVEAVRPSGEAVFGAIRRELTGATRDRRRIYSRSWSDRVHL